MVETIGGIDVPYEYVKECIISGKSVVTANKALVAAHGTELLEMAQKQDVNFLFEASVGGGMPIIRMLTESLSGERIISISGILNGTTNYILTKMDIEGSTFEGALLKAKELGYAELDPTDDIEGYDTGRKITILASLMTGCEIHFDDIYKEGITKIDTKDFAYAAKIDMSIKLIGRALYEDNDLYVYVMPMLVRSDNPLYAPKWADNGVVLDGNNVGISTLYGSGAGKFPTASNVIGDVIQALKINKNVPIGWSSDIKKVMPLSEASFEYLIRINKEDADKLKSKMSYKEIIDGIVDGEVGLITDTMKEKDISNLIKDISGIVKTVRIYK